MNSINQSETVSFTFHGQALNELSAQLPNDIIALNELIKNAYDANATEIRLEFNLDASQLIIQDNGSGISRNKLSKLFKIGYSEKEYGKKFWSEQAQEYRYTQGSKGLGFLAALRFGKEIEWITSDGEDAFSVKCHRDELFSLESVTEKSIPIRSLKKASQGTKVIMTVDDSCSKRLEKLLKSEVRLHKLVNCFLETNLNIKLYVDHEIRKVPKVRDFHSSCVDSQMAYVKILPKDNVAVMYHKGNEFDVIPIEGLPKDCKLSGELLIFFFRNQTASKVPDLFKKIKDGKTLCPLLYVNHNLFQNTDLFDPEITRKIRQDTSLPQIIGYIDILSDNEDLQFNADRTSLVQNEFSDSLESVLEKLNITIQQRASVYKPQKDEKPDLGYAPPPSDKSHVAGKILISKQLKRKIHDKQVNLRELIYRATDGAGNSIPFDKIEVFVNGEAKDPAILPSQENPCVFNLLYRYNCPLTGLIEASVVYTFVDNTKLPQQKFMPHVFRPANNEHMRIVAHAIKILNELYTKTNKREKKYWFVIACALRSIYELSVKSLRNCVYLPEKLTVVKDVEKTIENVILTLNGDNKIRERLRNVFQIDFNSLKNLDANEFKKQYLKSHLGAHNGDWLLNHGEVVDIAKQSSLFAYIVNAIHKAYYSNEEQ